MDGKGVNTVNIKKTGLAIILVVLFVGWVSQVTSETSTIIVKPCSYLIYQQDNQVIIQNGLTGIDEYQHSNPSKVFDYLLETSDGGSVYISKGVYEVVNDHLLDARNTDGYIFMGDGTQTILRVIETDNGHYDTLSFMNCDDIVIRDLQIEMQTDVGYNGCIDFDDGSNLLVENCVIIGDKQGVTFHGNHPQYVFDSTIQNCKITGGYIGIYILGNNRGHTIKDNHVTDGSYGICLTYAEQCTVVNNHVEDGTRSLYLYNSERCLVSGNIVDYVRESKHCKDNIVKDNIVVGGN